MENESCYVTGGAGFIGRHFNQCIDVSKVTNIDLRTQQAVPNQVRGDIRNIEDIRASIGDSSLILHLAASHYDFEKDYYQTNVEGTKNLLQVAEENDITRFVFFSSVAVYGLNSQPAVESTVPEPENDYGKSKLQAEKLIKEWVGKSENRKALIIRPAVVYGPHNYGNIFNLMRNIDRGRNFHIGNNPVIKSIAYVKNLIDATCYLSKNVDERYQVFNYVDEPQLTNFEISDLIARVLDKKRAFSVPYPVAVSLGHFFDVLSNIVDKELMISAKRVKKYCTSTHFAANKVRKYGFEPEYSTKTGLIETTNWFNENRTTWESEYNYLKKLFKSDYGITIE